jgi:hypothetical protein
MGIEAAGRAAAGGGTERRGALEDIHAHQAPGVVEDATERRVRQVPNGRKRMHLADEQDLRLQNVADAGEDALVEQGVRNRHAGIAPQAADDLLSIERFFRDVRAEHAELRMPR